VSAIIRLPDETDAEYQRRIRPVLDLLSKTLFSSQVGRLLENNNAITQHMRIAALRRSCGVRESGTFKFALQRDRRRHRLLRR
jgi:hypothetical protein